MADNSLSKLLLNRGAEKEQVVDAPAFSSTKVLQTAALVLTPLVSVLVKYISDLTFSPWQVVVLIVSVLGFLAVTASADVLARGLATSAEKFAQAGSSRSAEIVAIDPPRAARRVKDGEDTQVTIVAARAETKEFLVLEDSSLQWVPQADLRTTAG